MEANSHIRRHIRHNLSSLTLLLISILISADFASAETEFVLANEYVITTSEIPALQEKAIDLIAEVDDVAVLEAEGRSMLLTTAPEIWENLPVDAEDVGQSLCDKISRYARQALQKIRISGKNSGAITALRAQNLKCDQNAIMTTAAVPNDPQFSSLWGLNQSGNKDIDAPEAWDLQTGSSEVVIAIIDSGIDYNHPDLVDNMWRNTAEIAGNNIDDDLNGYVDDVHGINAIYGAPAPGNPMDDNSHGTHCAGTIGAKGNNGVGIVGVAHNVKMMGVKFLSSSGSGSLYDAVRAIDYINLMKSRGVNIKASSNSWGGGGFYQALYDAIARSRDRGVLFIAAAGNSNTNLDVTPSYPASYQLANVISVASTDESGGKSYFSSYGNSVSIAAPGSNIYSTIPNNGYGIKSGTSMATPHVSGVVALLASHFPQADYVELKTRLLNGARIVSQQLAGVSSGSRMLNAYGGLTSSYSPPGGPPTATPTPTAPPSTPTPGPSPTPTATPTQPPSEHFFFESVMAQKAVVAGTGVAGVKITLTLDNSETYVTYSNAIGDASFPRLRRGAAFQITREKEGYTINSSSGIVNADLHHQSVAVVNTYTLSGTVLDSNRQPLAGVAIIGGTLGTFMTDSNGRFTISSSALVHGSSYTLTAQKSDYIFPQVAGLGFIRGNMEHVLVALAPP